MTGKMWIIKLIYIYDLQSTINIILWSVSRSNNHSKMADNAVLIENMHALVLTSFCHDIVSEQIKAQKFAQCFLRWPLSNLRWEPSPTSSWKANMGDFPKWLPTNYVFHVMRLLGQAETWSWCLNQIILPQWFS